MPVLRYISILILNLLLILESSSLTMVALTSDDIAVNSLDALSLPIEVVERDIASTLSIPVVPSIRPELRLDIESLLDANREYAIKHTETTEEVIHGTGYTLSNTDILSSLERSDIFGDFLIVADTQLIE